MSQNSKSRKRQEQLRKKKQQQKKTAVLLIAVVVLACVGGIGWMVYDKNQKSRDEQAQAKKQEEEIQRSRENTDSETVNVEPLLEYLSELDTELMNEEIAPDVEDATEAAAEEP